jgi:Ca2+/Na+ antiporter
MGGLILSLGCALGFLICYMFTNRQKDLLGFLEENGEFSFARVAGITALVFYMVLANYIIRTAPIDKRAFVDIPPMLMSLILAAYGINKLPDIINAINAWKGNKKDDKPTG